MRDNQIPGGIMPRRALFISSLALGLVASTHAQEDPVLRARAQRASAQGIVEPPPLPPPEAHVKDSRKARKAKGKKRKSGTRKTKGSSAKVAATRKTK
jgi:hypothetical protein